MGRGGALVRATETSEDAVLEVHPTALETVLVRLGVPDHVARILTSTPALRLSWFSAVAVVLGIATLGSAPGRSPFLFLAPLLPIAGVALAFGPATDPAYDITRASPTSNFKLVLWRATAVLISTTALAAVIGIAAPLNGWLAAAWIAPSLAVTIASIALSTFMDPLRACGVVSFVWIAGVIVVGSLTQSATAIFRGPGQLAFFAIAVAGSIVVVRRRDRFEIQQRRVRRQVITAADAERRRLERNLHDGAQQHLVAIGIKIRLLKAAISTDPSAAEAFASELQTDVADALASLREVVRGMYPPLLEDRGLEAALDAHVGRFSLPVALEVHDVARYEPELEAAIYFSCLEAMQNIAKYAEASSVRVRVQDVGREIAFTISDDGKGFDVGRTARGSGLRNMEERMKAFGGSVAISSAPGAGTTISGRIPVAADA